MDGQLCYGVTTMTQPDLSIPPQFTAAYWEAAPRKRVPTNIEVEMIGEGLVTGMYLPDVKGWAFRMTAQNLADYARDYTEQEQAKQAAAQEHMRRFLAALIETYLVDNADGA